MLRIWRRRGIVICLKSYFSKEENLRYNICYIKDTNKTPTRGIDDSNTFSMCAGNRIIHTTGSLEPAHVMLAVKPGEPYGRSIHQRASADKPVWKRPQGLSPNALTSGVPHAMLIIHRKRRDFKHRLVIRRRIPPWQYAVKTICECKNSRYPYN